MLVDRVWPRGVSLEQAAIDHWFRDLAPGDELRKWFGHDPAKWKFAGRRHAGLDGRPAATAELRSLTERAASNTTTPPR